MTVDIERLVTHLLVFGVLGTDDVYPPLPLDHAAPIAHDLYRCPDLHSPRQYDLCCRVCGDPKVWMVVEMRGGKGCRPKARQEWTAGGEECAQHDGQAIRPARALRDLDFETRGRRMAGILPYIAACRPERVKTEPCDWTGNGRDGHTGGGTPKATSTAGDCVFSTGRGMAALRATSLPISLFSSRRRYRVPIFMPPAR